jgi:hypothetical protein
METESLRTTIADHLQTINSGGASLLSESEPSQEQVEALQDPPSNLKRD